MASAILLIVLIGFLFWSFWHSGYDRHYETATGRFRIVEHPVGAIGERIRFSDGTERRSVYYVDFEQAGGRWRRVKMKDGPGEYHDWTFYTVGEAQAWIDNAKADLTTTGDNVLSVH